MVFVFRGLTCWVRFDTWHMNLQGSQSSGWGPLINSNLYLSQPVLGSLFKLSHDNKDGLNIVGLKALNAISCIKAITYVCSAFSNKYKWRFYELSSHVFWLKMYCFSNFNTILSIADLRQLLLRIGHFTTMFHVDQLYKTDWNGHCPISFMHEKLRSLTVVLYHLWLLRFKCLILFFLYFRTADGSQTHMLNRTADRNVLN